MGNLPLIIQDRMGVLTNKLSCQNHVGLPVLHPPLWDSHWPVVLTIQYSMMPLPGILVFVIVSYDCLVACNFHNWMVMSVVLRIGQTLIDVPHAHSTCSGAFEKKTKVKVRLFINAAIKSHNNFRRSAFYTCFHVIYSCIPVKYWKPKLHTNNALYIFPHFTH